MFSYRFFIEEGVFFGPDFDMRCGGQNEMQFVWSNDILSNGTLRGWTWRCTRNSCCNQGRKTPRAESFFLRRGLDIRIGFMIVYYWLNKMSNQTINFITGTDPATIRRLITDFQYMMEQDVKDEELMIGMCQNQFL